MPLFGGGSIAGPVLTLVAVLLPALITWWTDRRLLDKGDDPALPELLASRRRTNVRAMAIGFAIVVVFGGGEAAWGIPLLAVALIAVAYPLRTRLLGETWSFGSYLWHTLLSVAGGFGFWILLAYAPGIVNTMLRSLGPERWQIAAVLAGVLAVALLAFEEWYPRVWLWTHAARPLEDPVLTPRFEEIVRRAGTISPRVYQVGPQGSRFVNAVALPSVKRPAVAMGTALIELLEPDETTAIFAHEIAHFDHFTPTRVRRGQLINRLLIVCGVAFPFLTTFAAGGTLRWLSWVWPFAVLAALLRRAAKSQQHETESDLRAAALCGDPEALVRGLVKLHLSARIPRRYALEVERAATHPSLVRRIQAIRAGGGAVAEQLGAAAAVRSTRAGSWVVLDADRVYWLDGVPDGVSGELAALREAASSYRAVSYADLVELRVAATGSSRTLSARVRGGEAWSVPIGAEDVARVQRALDVVDLRLGRATPEPSGALAKIIPLAALIATMLSGQVGVVLVPIILAMWKRNGATFAALGAMTIVRAALGSIEGGRWFEEDVVRLGLVAMAAIGVGALYTAWRMARGGEERRNVRLVTMVLGFGAIVIVTALVLLTAGASSASLAGVPLVSALGTLIVGMAAALWFLPARWSRPIALATLTLGVAAAAVGVDRKAFTLRRAFAETTATATPVSEVDLGGAATGLRVSPSGESFLAVSSPITRRSTPRAALSLRFGRFGGSVREVSAISAEFVDDRRVLVLDQVQQGMELRIEPVDSGAVVWADTLADVGLIDARLIVDRDSSAWAIVGEDSDDDRTVVYAGKIGLKGSSKRASIPDTVPMVGDPIVFGAASTVIVPAYVATMRGQVASAFWALPLLGLEPFQSQLWRVRGDSLVRQSSLRGVPECGGPANGAATCTTRHTRATSLYAVDANGVAEEVARLPSQDLGVVSLGPGLRAASMKYDRSIQLIDLATRRLTKIPLPRGSDYAAEVRSGPGWVATLSYAENRRSKVRLYRIE